MRKGHFILHICGVGMVIASLFVSGCAVNFYKQSPKSKEKIKVLETKIDDLEKERQEENMRFEQTKRLLEQKLREQIQKEQVSLEMNERGLVIILSDDILFDSGKAVLKEGSFDILEKFIAIVAKELPDKNIGVFGHTDNVPIKLSGWKSNWELSAARATNVLYYLEENGIQPKQLSSTGHGEYRPIASNDTPEGRSKNRRVELVILPEFAEKKQDIMESDEGLVK